MDVGSLSAGRLKRLAERRIVRPVGERRPASIDKGPPRDSLYTVHPQAIVALVLRELVESVIPFDRSKGRERHLADLTLATYALSRGLIVHPVCATVRHGDGTESR